MFSLLFQIASDAFVFGICVSRVKSGLANSVVEYGES